VGLVEGEATYSSLSQRDKITGGEAVQDKCEDIA